MPAVGVLALQGDVREHLSALSALSVRGRAVLNPGDLNGLDGLIIPGGESTAIARLLDTGGLRDPLGRALADGLPVLGTCAGLILLATAVLDGRADQWSFSRLDVAVRRNGFGRQVASFEATVELAAGPPVTGVFIRAPRIESVGAGVEILGTLDRDGSREPVLVRQGPAWGCSFHPELTGENEVHALFLGAL